MIKVKRIFLIMCIISVLSIVLTVAIESGSCYEINELNQGETKMFRFSDGKDYEIELQSIEDNKATFVINGEQVTPLVAGEIYILPNEKEFMVKTVSENSAEFCDNAEPEEEAIWITSQCKRTNEIKQGETKTRRYRDHKDYEVKLVSIDNNQALFIVNGEDIPQMDAGNSYVLANGKEFVVREISDDSADFCIDGDYGQEIIKSTSLCSETNKLKKGEANLFMFRDGKAYEIELQSIEDNKAVFMINGEKVTPLAEGNSYMVTEEKEFMVKTISENYAEFCMNTGFEDDNAVWTKPECLETNEQEEGETKKWTFRDGKDYEIELRSVEDGKAKFVINGEEITSLVAGNSFILADESEFMVSKVSSNSAEFCINDYSGEEFISPTPDCYGTNKLMKGQKKSFRYADGKDYEIEIKSIEDDGAVLLVNGEETDEIEAGKSVLLPNDEELIISYINNNYVKLCINGNRGEEKTAPSHVEKKELSEKDKETKSEDQCSSDDDCDDSYACTLDTCSGTPKKCSSKRTSSGCELNDNCVPISTRKNKMYCDIDNSMKDQKPKDAECDNYYECASNVCVNSKCIEANFIQKIINWFAKLLG